MKFFVEKRGKHLCALSSGYLLSITWSNIEPFFYAPPGVNRLFTGLH
jgi:hypothetical protein